MGAVLGVRWQRPAWCVPPVTTVPVSLDDADLLTALAVLTETSDIKSMSDERLLAETEQLTESAASSGDAPGADGRDHGVTTARQLIDQGRRIVAVFEDPASTAAFGRAQTWCRTNLSRLLDGAELALLMYGDDKASFTPAQRDLVTEVCHDLMNRALREERDAIPDSAASQRLRDKENAIRALLDAYTQAIAGRAP